MKCSSELTGTMLTILGSHKQLCDGVTRRRFLQVGGLGMFSLGWSDLLRLRDAQASSVRETSGLMPPFPVREGGRGGGFGKAKACIILYLYGAPSQLDTFDLKPDAPAEIRGDFKPISTVVPGLQICEHLPRMAKLMDRVTLIRSMTHPYNNHAVAYTLSGIPFSEPMIEANEKEPRHWPYLGSTLNYVWERSGKLAHLPPDIPSNLILPWKLNSKTPNKMHGGVHAAWLGQQHDPIIAEFTGRASREEGAPSASGNLPARSHFDPFDGITPDSSFRLAGSAPQPEITLDRLNRRRTLLQQFNSARRTLDSADLRGFDRYQELAFSMLTSQQLANALDVTKEPAKLRERYGMTLFGQGALTARRLVEAGVKLVTVFWDEYGPVNTAWDTHYNHHPRMKDGLLPGLDQVFPAFLADMQSRGLLDETLVCLISEHGRTPKITNVPGGGREHWSGAYCGLFAGAGINEGLVIGQTDAEAGYPVERPISPKDVLCTIYHLLGVDPRTEIPDRLGNPKPLVPEGEIIKEMLG